MKCPYCNEFKGNNKVRGYPVRDQLRTHILAKHQKEARQQIANIGYGSSEALRRH